ncbi:MAG: hypothetical protein IC227_00330 [Enterococcus lacertideformus]|uniref:Uncharacterized protein n=1 Tax=Enterococcus lacertideformus TaxID=2771493 RepID=A0A931AYC8_9ENTE|nr:hypothetical protein [Enterococcus lacertideformus]
MEAISQTLTNNTEVFALEYNYNTPKKSNTLKKLGIEKFEFTLDTNDSGANKRESELSENSLHNDGRKNISGKSLENNDESLPQNDRFLEKRDLKEGDVVSMNKPTFSEMIFQKSENLRKTKDVVGQRYDDTKTIHELPKPEVNQTMSDELKN